MEEPVKLIGLTCPLCGIGRLHLDKRKFRHIPKDKNYSLDGEWFIYVCDHCKEGFTTTESDTISMNNLKQRKL